MMDQTEAEKLCTYEAERHLDLMRAMGWKGTETQDNLLIATFTAGAAYGMHLAAALINEGVVVKEGEASGPAQTL